MRMISISSRDATINRGGRPPAPEKQHMLVLREIVAELPALSLDAITALREQHSGIRVCNLKVCRALAAALVGVQRKAYVHSSIGWPMVGAPAGGIDATLLSLSGRPVWSDQFRVPAVVGRPLAVLGGYQLYR